MIDTSEVKEIIRLSFNKTKPSITLETDWSVVIVLVSILIVLAFLRRRIYKKLKWHQREIEISGTPKAVFKVERNEENLYIANRIYIELTTRKAAIPIDEANDVIEEIYDSWYKLFGIIRDELKALPGKYLKHHDATSALIGISRKILNDALRPHLTEHQAKFRRWIERAKEDPANTGRSPQEIQQEYPDFQNLITSMKTVNLTLINYADELNNLMKGK